MRVTYIDSKFPAFPNFWLPVTLRLVLKRRILSENLQNFIDTYSVEEFWWTALEVQFAFRAFAWPNAPSKHKFSSGEKEKPQIQFMPWSNRREILIFTLVSNFSCRESNSDTQAPPEELYTSAPHKRSTQALHTNAPNMLSTQSLHTSAPHKRSTQALTTSAPYKAPQTLHTNAPHKRSTQARHTQLHTRSPHLRST